MALKGSPRIRDASSFRVRGAAMAAWYVAGLAACSPLVAAAIVANRLYGIPLFTGDGGSLDVIAARCTVGVAGNIRLGIYAPSPTTLLPDAKLYDSANIDVTAAGVKFIDPNFLLPPDSMVWLAIVSDVAPTFQCVPVASAAPVLGMPAAFNTLPQVGLYAPHVFGALPATFNAGGAFVPITAPPLPAIAVHLE